MVGLMPVPFRGRLTVGLSGSSLATARVPDWSVPATIGLNRTERVWVPPSAATGNPADDNTSKGPLVMVAELTFSWEEPGLLTVTVCQSLEVFASLSGKDEARVWTQQDGGVDAGARQGEVGRGPVRVIARYGEDTRLVALGRGTEPHREVVGATIRRNLDPPRPSTPRRGRW